MQSGWLLNYLQLMGLKVKASHIYLSRVSFQVTPFSWLHTDQWLCLYCTLPKFVVTFQWYFVIVF